MVLKLVTWDRAGVYTQSQEMITPETASRKGLHFYDLT